MGGLKSFLRVLTPPLLWDNLREARNRWRSNPTVSFSGDYSSWEAVNKLCGSGYANPLILERVAMATRKVRDGQAAYDRDATAFSQPVYRYPLLAAVGRAAQVNPGRLTVLDFGGALGTTYYQHKSILKDYSNLTWAVVEQEHFVTLGRKEFENNQLKFFISMDEAVAAGQPDLIHASGVIPWLSDPESVLRKLLNIRAPYVFLDRLALTELPDRLTLQVVPPEIYPAKYPAWFLNREKFMNVCLENYALVDEADAIDQPALDGNVYQAKGFLFKRS